MWNVWIKHNDGVEELLISDVPSYALANRIGKNVSDIFGVTFHIIEEGD